jgi:hypothetical protein
VSDSVRKRYVVADVALGVGVSSLIAAAALWIWVPREGTTTSLSRPAAESQCLVRGGEYGTMAAQLAAAGTGPTSARWNRGGHGASAIAARASAIRCCKD